uniref:NADH dehydrogenase subunit 6 n=1 Tax=Megaxyela euchroma TaxID=1874363 RepID=UPI00220293D5|nr:NADH dehydrogenase subunit 6 [Megaxyela euchroma]UXP85893.1 NADH dehydrogenase subunit 6 [Megaxyela euchroma]
MILTLLYMMSIITGTVFMLMKHPLAMGLMLLIQTLMVCMITGLISPTFWFSYILFLIMLGGMLVLFIYMTSLASNEMFNMSTKLIIMMIMFFMLMTLIMYFNDLFYSSFSMFNKEMINLISSETINNLESNLMVNKIYNKPSMLITLMLINYLFLTLIIVVKITNINMGPLRSKN